MEQTLGVLSSAAEGGNVQKLVHRKCHEEELWMGMFTHWNRWPRAVVESP